MTLVAAIVYSFWATSAVSAASKIEKIEVGAYVIKSGDIWSVTVAVLVRNLGEVDTSIDNIYLNSKPIGENGAYDFKPQDPSVDPIRLKVGQSLTIMFKLPGDIYKSGMLVILTVHTSTNQLHTTPLYLE